MINIGFLNTSRLFLQVNGYMCVNIKSFKLIISNILTDKWIPLDSQNACNFGCCHAGCNSTWLTAGGTRAIANRSWSFFEEKLLTPIALAFPESYSASIALHVLGMSVWSRFSGLNPTDPFFMRTGQCIYKTHQFNWFKEETNGWNEHSNSALPLHLLCKTNTIYSILWNHDYEFREFDLPPNCQHKFTL